MNGKMLIIGVTGAVTAKAVNRPPTLKELQCAVGGPLEGLPRFNKLSVPENWGRMFADITNQTKVVAFVDEEGMRHGRPMNLMGTVLWARAIGYKGCSIDESAALIGDVVKGDMVILYGDDEFMAEL